MSTPTDIHIEPVTSESDFPALFHVVASAFGRQTRDAIWLSINPNFGTPEGQQRGAASLATRWKHITKDRNGEPNTVFLKATVPDPGASAKDGAGEGKRVIAGMAIWQQASFKPGYGDVPSDKLPDADLDGLDEKEKRFASQMFGTLWKRRIEYAREISESEKPAIFVLDMCAVDPAFQKRGIAGRLVQWGLDEAKRRGGLECTTEASRMGRTVYMKLGFKKEEGEMGNDMVWEVDEEFRGRELPPNVFLRTGV
jgi:GNAT superfamily N-acetyltransferase